MSELRRVLGSEQLSLMAIGGAIGTGLFLGSGFAIGLAGPAVLLSYAIGGAIAFLLMGALAEMTIAHPSAGSFGWLAERYVGRFAGFLVRYAYWAANVLAVGTEVTAAAVVMRFWFPDLPGWIWIVGFAALLLSVHLFGVLAFGRTEATLSLVKIAAILAFLCVGAWFLWHAPAASHAAAPLDWFPHGAGGMWVAVLVAIFSYLGIETISVAAGEAVDPSRAILRAFRLTLFRLCFFYLATLALTLAIVPWREAGISVSPFVTVMQATGIPGAGGVLNAVVLVASLSSMNSQLYASTRMLFALSRAGYAPRALGTVGARGVPVAATLASSAGIAVAVAVTAADPQGAFAVMIAVSIFGALFTWCMIFVTHLFFRAAHPKPARSFRMRGAPWTSLAGMLALLALLATTLATPAFRLTLAVGVPFLGLLGLAWIAGARRCGDAGR